MWFKGKPQKMNVRYLPTFLKSGNLGLRIGEVNVLLNWCKIPGKSCKIPWKSVMSCPVVLMYGFTVVWIGYDGKTPTFIQRKLGSSNARPVIFFGCFEKMGIPFNYRWGFLHLMYLAVGKYNLTLGLRGLTAAKKSDTTKGCWFIFDSTGRWFMEVEICCVWSVLHNSPAEWMPDSEMLSCCIEQEDSASNIRIYFIWVMATSIQTKKCFVFFLWCLLQGSHLQ